MKGLIDISKAFAFPSTRPKQKKNAKVRVGIWGIYSYRQKKNPAVNKRESQTHRHEVQIKHRECHKKALYPF
jgi:hypothetical protein